MKGRMNTESKPKLYLKSRILSLTEYLQSNPSLKKGEGEVLTSPGNPLTNITTIKLSRKKTEDFEPKVCVCVCVLKCVL